MSAAPTFLVEPAFESLKVAPSMVAADAPRKLPPKGRSVAYGEGVYTYDPECACWMCSDEAPAERIERRARRRAA